MSTSATDLFFFFAVRLPFGTVFRSALFSLTASGWSIWRKPLLIHIKQHILRTVLWFLAHVVNNETLVVPQQKQHHATQGQHYQAAQQKALFVQEASVLTALISEMCVPPQRSLQHRSWALMWIQRHDEIFCLCCAHCTGSTQRFLQAACCGKNKG